MIGRRLPVVDGKPTWPEQPGDYCGPVTGFTGELPAVFMLKPNAEPGAALWHVVSPPHFFRECEDGSLAITPSLSDKRSGSDRSDGWHGYLDEGHVWRQV